MWNHEKDLILSHLDLSYSRKKTNDNNDKTDVESFLKQCYEKVVTNKAIKNFSLQQSSIFKIGKRGSPNYYRVYENHT